MTTTDLIKALSDRLDNAQARIGLLDAYYDGNQPLAFLAPDAREALGDRFGRMSSNIPRLAVTSLAERLRVTGFTRDGQPDPALWAAWLRNDLDQLAPVAHREALTLGRSYALVWADPDGRPRVSIESARQVTTITDPATRAVVAAFKRWVDPAARKGYAVLYEPDQITRYVSDANVADPAALPATSWTATGTIRNPFGVVPMVPIVNTDRILDLDGASELDDLIPLVDGLNKALADLLVTSEYFARPRRWATGLELIETDDGQVQNPIPDAMRMMVSESPDTKFGQLDAADLASYEAAVRVLLGQIMAVSALPAHFIGITSANPSSADALRAAEASLAARAEARQATFGRSWEAVGRLVVAASTGTDPAAVAVSCQWADPSTRSVAQEADAVVKLFSAGLLPASTALAKLGYSDDEIASIRSARRAEALDSAGVDLKAVAS